MQLFQNYPNPVYDQTTVTLYVPEKGNVGIMIYNIHGRKVISTDKELESGYHSFRLVPGNIEVLFLTAYFKATIRTIKIFAPGNNTGFATSLEYTGSSTIEPPFKRIRAARFFSFNLNDTLLYIGYAGSNQSAIPDRPDTNDTFYFQFATNIPCPGIPTVTYEGHVYNTIQINNQCWLKENLNIGTMISVAEDMSDNGIIEKYCYDDDLINCDTLGGFYQWNEMMQYTTLQGSRGLCPPDWHIPTDLEWKILEGIADSWYRIGDPEWNIPFNWRGFDAGKRLKTEIGWDYNGNGTNLYGYSAYPAGCRFYLGGFIFMGSRAHLWSSSLTGDGTIWARILGFDYDNINRDLHHEENGFSIRCLRDIPSE